MIHTLKFSEWLANEVTLYHGTVIDNEQGIAHYGLLPKVGSFTRSAYDIDDGDYDDRDEAVYMSNKTDLNKATTAMVTAIAKKLNKSESEVTDEDISRNGLLCVVEDPNDTITRKQDDSEDHPKFAEPDDYYSRDALTPTRILKGTSLIRFLKRYHAWPITWTFKKLSTQEDNYLRGKLTANAIKQHPDKSVEEIRKKVASLNQRDAESMYKTYYGK